MFNTTSKKSCFSLLLILSLAGPFIARADTPGALASSASALPAIPEQSTEPASDAMKEQKPMPRHIIRVISISHCKRGPEHCAKCRAMGGRRICLLDIAPPDQGMVQRRVIGIMIDSERVWREFDVVRVFADEAEARAWAANHKVDIDLETPAE